MTAPTRRGFLKNVGAVLLAATGGGEVAGLRSANGGRSEAVLRPPGALPEDAFLARCIRCLRCVQACPNRALQPLGAEFGRHRQSTPAIFARKQACMLCNGLEGDALRCTAACPTGVLRRISKDPETIRRLVRMGTAEIDRNLCYSYNGWSCGTCYRACPLPGEAMTIGLWERPSVNPDVCLGCGLCERACIRYPQAIRVRPRSARASATGAAT